jgi:glyoxylase I family protein
LHVTEGPAPAITGIHHFSVTVRDIESSAAWYQRVFRAQRVPMTFPHYEREDTGYGVLLLEPRSGLAIGLHTNTGNNGVPFDEAQTGLDHVGFNVAGRDELEAWTRGSTSWPSSTRASGPETSRFLLRQWCSAIRTISSWSSSRFSDLCSGLGQAF